MPEAEAVNQIADGAAQDEAEARADGHSIEKSPKAAADQDKREKNSDTYKIKDSKNQGMALKNTESGAGILDADNLEKAEINEDFVNGQMGQYPPLAELVGDDDKQRNTGEDNVPPLIGGVVQLWHSSSAAPYN
jgi:hypothetical protein